MTHPTPWLVLVATLALAACGTTEHNEGTTNPTADQPQQDEQGTTGPGTGEPAQGEPGPVDAARAREIADRMAAGEIRRVEQDHRRSNPDVVLRMEDYTVTAGTTEVPDPAFTFLYVYSREDPPFELWAGHGMHFSVRVNRETGEPLMMGGE